MIGACNSVGRLLSPYIDDQLPGPDRSAVDRHLASCPGCTARLADLRAGQAVVAAYLNAEVDRIDLSGFSRRVAQGLKREPLGFGPQLRLWWAELMAYHSTVIYSSLGAATAAALAVAFVGGRAAVPTSNEMVVHSLEVTDPGYEPVVMYTDDGETVIMLVQHQEDPDEAPQPALHTKTTSNEPPHGGNL